MVISSFQRLKCAAYCCLHVWHLTGMCRKTQSKVWVSHIHRNNKQKYSIPLGMSLLPMPQVTGINFSSSLRERYCLGRFLSEATLWIFKVKEKLKGSKTIVNERRICRLIKKLPIRTLDKLTYKKRNKMKAWIREMFCVIWALGRKIYYPFGISPIKGIIISII